MAEFINRPKHVDVNLSLIVALYLLSYFLHGHAIDQILTISPIKNNLHYWVTGVATGMKIRVLHFH